MGSYFHYTIINFFEKILTNCDKVTNYNVIEKNDFLVYSIERNHPYHSFNVYLTDSYLFTLSDYYNKPKHLKANDFIYLPAPQQNCSNEVYEQANFDSIYIGKANFLVKFLNSTLDEIN